MSQAVLLGGRWKGIREKSLTAPIKLFDLATDPAEQTDLAAQRPEIATRLAEIMRTAHTDNEHWKIPALQASSTN